MNNKKFQDKVVYGVGVGFAVISILTSQYTLLTNKIFPRFANVKEGFVPPSDIEVTVGDLDKDGKEEETIMTIKGEPFALKYDKDGTPVLLRYKAIPARVEYLDRDNAEYGIQQKISR